MFNTNKCIKARHQTGWYDRELEQNWEGSLVERVSLPSPRPLDSIPVTSAEESLKTGCIPRLVLFVYPILRQTGR